MKSISVYRIVKMDDHRVVAVIACLGEYDYAAELASIIRKYRGEHIIIQKSYQRVLNLF